MKMVKYYIYSLICILCCTTSILSQSKGGRWQFENNGFDTADWDAVENTGTLQNQAGYGNAAPLVEGSAYLWLDSIQVYNYFRVDDDNDLDFTDEDIAISLWIYPIVLNDVHYLINKGRQDSNPKTTNYALRISRNSWNLEFLIRDLNNQAQKVASSFTISTNQWTFLAVFYDFSENKVYMWNDPNSSPADTLDFSQSFFANGDPLSIGSWYRADSTSHKDFEGRIDDVRISGRIQDVIPGVTFIQNPRESRYSTAESNMVIYPNPVRLSELGKNVNIQFQTKSRENVSISVFNVLGQELFSERIRLQTGFQNFSLNIRQKRIIPFQTGLYFIRIKGETVHQIHKFMILK